MEGSDTLVRQHEVYFRTWEAVAMEAVPEETQEAALTGLAPPVANRAITITRSLRFGEMHIEY